MEIKLSIGTLDLIDPIDSDLQELELQYAVMAQEYQNRIKTAGNSDIKQKYQLDLSRLLKELTYKLQAAYVGGHDLDLNGQELWVYLRDNVRRSDAIKLKKTIDALGNEGNGVKPSTLKASSVSLVTTPILPASSAGETSTL